jgi:hypothetical protein
MCRHGIRPMIYLDLAFHSFIDRPRANGTYFARCA